MRRKVTIGSLLVAIIGGLLLWWLISSLLSGSGEPSPTATATAQPPNTAPAALPAPSGPHCDEQPDLPHNWRGYLFRQQANTAAALNTLAAVKSETGTELQLAGYAVPVPTTGQPSLSDMLRWVKQVQCQGWAAAINLDQVYTSLGTTVGNDWAHQLASTGVVAYWLVFQHDSADSTAAATNLLVSQVNSAATNLSVIVMHDLMATSQPVNNALSQAFTGNLNTIAYWPDFGSAAYGDESNIPLAASTETYLNHGDAVGMLQSFSWPCLGGDDFQFQLQKGFNQPESGNTWQVQGGDVARMANQYAANNVLRLFAYDQGTGAEAVQACQATSADNVTHIVQVVNAIAGAG